MKKTFAEIQEREDRRVAERKKDEERARRTLMPVMVAVCETYGVTPDDIISRSVHRDVVMARNIVIYLGWDRCKIGPTILASILSKDRSDISHKLPKLKSSFARGRSFHQQVSHVTRRIRSIERGLQAKERQELAS